MIDFTTAHQQILEELAELIETSPDQLDERLPFSEIGIDSLDAVHLVATIESIIGQELPEDVMQRVTCLNDIFEMMRVRIAAA